MLVLVLAMGVCLVCAGICAAAEPAERRWAPAERRWAPAERRWAPAERRWAPAERRWSPVKDEVYLQETGRQVPTESPVRAVAAFDGDVYAGLDAGVRILKDNAFAACGGPEEAVERLRSVDSALFAITVGGLYRLCDGKWECLGEGRFTDVVDHLGRAIVAAPGNLFVVDDGALVPLPGAANAPGSLNPPGEIQRLASYSESLYCLVSGRLVVFNRGTYDENTVDWGRPMSDVRRDILGMGSRLYIATDNGLGLLRGTGLTHLRGAEGLCYEDTVCLAEGFDGDLWVGTTRGAIRKTRGEWHYVAGRRWLPNDVVNDIAVSGKSVYVATDGGLGIIEYVPYTLMKKAAYYVRHLDEWGHKRIGFVHHLVWDDAANAWVRHVSDNDGGWTAHYLAAQCFRYAVTGNEEARREAVKSFNAMKWLEEVSSIDGFPARAVWAKGETGDKTMGGSGGFPAEWIDTPDGQWEWKADTSADEVDAHFYATAVFHDLVAQGPEKERAQEHLARITSHIIDNGWILRDLDGEPTMWGRWDPEYFASERGFHAIGLNGLEVLSYMKTAYAVTGDAKFREAFEKLIDMGYLREIVRPKLTEPPGEDHHPDDVLRRDLILPLHGNCHPDDRLAFFDYYNLLRYEDDPELRSMFMRSLERSWEVERIEHNPWFNFIYGALTGNECEADMAVKHLREWPLDLVEYAYRNSHRADLATPPGYVPHSGVARAISPRETGGYRWDSSLRLDGGRDGRVVQDPSGWLEAYWMGRYYGFITAPETDDPALVSVGKRDVQRGAAPYDGPTPPYLKGGDL